MHVANLLHIADTNLMSEIGLMTEKAILPWIQSLTPKI